MSKILYDETWTINATEQHLRMRDDFVTDEIVTATELMRRELDRNRDDDGNIQIRINTFSLEKNDGFFKKHQGHACDCSPQRRWTCNSYHSTL